MTSKEKCYKLYSDFDETEDRGYNVYDYFKAILKDLEILELLKKKAYFYSINENPKVASIQINVTTLDDNFDKVEEWVNNDKR